MGDLIIQILLLVLGFAIGLNFGIMIGKLL